MPASFPISFGSETLTLMADRALFWEVRQTLVLADVHLGKDASFRAAGLPVPAGNSARDLARISALLSLTQASRLAILGDLVHSRSSHQSELADTFAAWRARHADLQILLIRGNHDLHAGPTPDDWHITECAEPFHDGPLAFAHKPQPSDRPLLCGHVHPTASVRDFDGSAAGIPCFVVDPGQLILPAFGSFTGGFRMDAETARTLYAVTTKSVVRVPPGRG